MASDEFYKQDKDKIVEVQKQLEKTQAGLARCYTRWEQLEPERRLLKYFLCIVI
jgi:hypothetical protein